MVEHVTSLPGLPGRPLDAHKGSFGRVLVVGGSRGMSGAVCLAGGGALRGGAGLVTLAIPAGIGASVAASEPSWLTCPVNEDAEGRMSLAASGELARAAEAATVVAIGPGWGQSPDIVQLAEQLYGSVRVPLVADADALNALARGGNRVLVESPEAGPRVLTPHPGEFARLTGVDTATVQANRESMAVEYAAERGVILVLKGAGTLVTDGTRVAENRTGNPGMATGGSGDVLTGLLSALLAQAMNPFEAAQLAVHLHGLAGDLAAEELGQHALIASDLVEFLPGACRSL